MLGLAHRGWSLNDYRHHLVHTLREAGYHSTLIGEQHISKEPDVIGYDRVVKIETTRVHDVAPIAIELLRSARTDHEPFFFSIGFFETHREFFDPGSVRDALYSRPPANLPDDPATRRDMAAFKASARSLDQGIGAVLGALDAYDIADDTLVILTTDHGLAFPSAKASLYDRGLGVMLIIRGPGGFTGGKVNDALVSHIDIYPTICDLLEIRPPEWLQGVSMMPLVRGEAREVRDALFAEATYHAAYEPQRCIRTRYWKYVRRFDDSRTGPVLANCDDGPSKSLLIERGWKDHVLAKEQLYELTFDPNEAHNRIDDPAAASVRDELRERLETWMRETDDPLLAGPIAPPPGVEVNTPDQASPLDPTVKDWKPAGL
jgi:arylsulfatase A-like enzyme